MKIKTNIYVCYAYYKSQRAEGYRTRASKNLPEIICLLLRRLRIENFVRGGKAHRMKQKQKQNTSKLVFFFKYFSFSYGFFFGLIKFSLACFPHKHGLVFQNFAEWFGLLAIFPQVWTTIVLEAGMSTSPYSLRFFSVILVGNCIKRMYKLKLRMHQGHFIHCMPCHIVYNDEGWNSESVYRRLL